MNNIGRNQSEAARKSIELEFGLTQAEGRKQTQENPLKVRAQKVQYGKTQTKRAITNVLDVVVDQYKYTSLAELNAILKLYNVMADRGKEDTKMFEKRGLVYTALDDKGNKIGTPIKASAFYSKPTLKYLEQKFIQNEPLRHVHQLKLKTAIKWTLAKKKLTLDEFKEALAREGINVVLRQNAQGNIYGITYVDFRTKCVFNGSDLGKEYSAKGILEQLSLEHKQEGLKLSQEQTNGVGHGSTDVLQKEHKQVQEQNHQQETRIERINALELLLKPEQTNDYIPNKLLKKKKQKKQSRGLRI